MKVMKNEKLRLAVRAKNFADYAEAWLDSLFGEDPQRFQVAFLEDLYPAAKVVAIETRLPLEGFGTPYVVHVHMNYAGSVFSLVGEGNTHEAALMSCVLDGEPLVDRLKTELELGFP